MPKMRIAAFLVAALCPIFADAADAADAAGEPARYDSVESFVGSMQGSVIGGQWRLIGVSFQRSSAYVTAEGGETVYDLCDAVRIDRNVLTGKVILKFTPRGKKTLEKQIRVAPQVLLFQDYDESQGSLEQFDGYAEC